MKNAQNFRFKPTEIGVFNASADQPLVLFEKDCRILGFTRGQFSLIDLIRSTLRKTGPARVICCTWSAGIKDAYQIKWMLDSELIQAFTLITDHSYVTRQSKYAVAIDELFGPENIRTSEIHAKFVLIHNEEYKVSIRTSMNLNANKTCETFEIDEGKDVFDFHYEFVRSMLHDMPEGFEASSWKANKALDRFFTANASEIEQEQPIDWFSND